MPLASPPAPIRRHAALVLIGPAPAQLPLGVQVLPTWEAFEASSWEPDGFMVTEPRVDRRDAVCHEVRRSTWWDRPVYALPGGSAPAPFFDGALPVDDAVQAANRMAAVRATLRLEPNTLQREERLLYYLYLRSPSELVPQRDRQARQLYTYPAAEALADPSDHVEAWLAGLVHRGLLAPETVIDRTRHCVKCASAHLHYLDVCPHCSSIQIRKAASLHCFTCGHVAPEADFRDAQGLACPKCATRLRHIGVDYDRPLTQYACASCHHAFIEANIVARCLDCDTMADPATLDVREVAALTLTPQGRAALRAGQIEESFAALDLPNSVVPNFFRRMVDWALATSQRHPAMTFGLVLIEFVDAAGMVESLGAARAFLVLDEFARRLHELLRTSDITTRTNEQRLWLFLPFSSTEGFVKRLQQVLEQRAVQGQGELKVRIRHMEAPKDAVAGEQAQQLMLRLEEQLRAP